MSATKAMRITQKYCRGLLERHELTGEISDNSMQIDASTLVQILEAARPNDRFRVSFDPMSYGEDDEDTWDLVGPSLPQGRVYYPSRGDAEADRDALNAILREHLGPITRKAQYTNDAYVAKCLMDAPCCPACGSPKTELNEDRHMGATCVLLRGCNDCNAEWEEVFALQGYKDLRMD